MWVFRVRGFVSACQWLWAACPVVRAGWVQPCPVCEDPTLSDCGCTKLLAQRLRMAPASRCFPGGVSCGGALSSCMCV